VPGRLRAAGPAARDAHRRAPLVESSQLYPADRSISATWSSSIASRPRSGRVVTRCPACDHEAEPRARAAAARARAVAPRATAPRASPWRRSRSGCARGAVTGGRRRCRTPPRSPGATPSSRTRATSPRRRGDVRSAARLRALVAAGAPPRGPWLDVVCSSGVFLDVVTAAGAEAWGVEPSAWLAEIARRGHGDRVRCAPLEGAALPAEAFGVVTLWYVLEHVPDPRGFLALARRHLVPGGLLALKVPARDSYVARALRGRWPLLLPEHLHYFTRPSLRALLREAGLEAPSFRLHVVHSRSSTPSTGSPSTAGRSRAACTSGSAGSGSGPGGAAPDGGGGRRGAPTRGDRLTGRRCSSGAGAADRRRVERPAPAPPSGMAYRIPAPPVGAPSVRAPRGHDAARAAHRHAVGRVARHAARWRSRRRRSRSRRRRRRRRRRRTSPRGTP
jgi:SAM-dependent methyltransferase